jgi:hypothetical protein
MVKPGLSLFGVLSKIIHFFNGFDRKRLVELELRLFVQWTFNIQRKMAKLTFTRFVISHNEYNSNENVNFTDFHLYGKFDDTCKSRSELVQLLKVFC